MASPTYKGEGQPALGQSNSLLGRLGAFLGNGGGPAYEGTGQPVLQARGLLGSAAPVYRQAPPPAPVSCAHDEEPTMPEAPPGTRLVRALIVYPEGSDPCAQDPIAILVPRQDK
jgi:hypothetical protein